METSTSSAHQPRFGRRLRKHTAQGFQLNEHPRTIVAVILFIALAVYAVVDIFLTAGTGYASTPPYGLFAAGGIILAAAGYRWLRHGAVPVKEAAGMAILVGISFATALYPGLMRVSTLLAAGPYQTYSYRLTADLTLHPDNPALPSFSAPLDRRYWHEQAAGNQWQLEMRHGAFGLWLYRIKPLQGEIDAFYFRQELSKHLQPTIIHPPKHQ